MTPNELYLHILISAAPKFAAKDNNTAAAQHNADILARGCVEMCSRMGILEAEGVRSDGQRMPSVVAAAPVVAAPPPQPIAFPQDPPAVVAPIAVPVAAPIAPPVAMPVVGSHAPAVQATVHGLVAQHGPTPAVGLPLDQFAQQQAQQAQLAAQQAQQQQAMQNIPPNNPLLAAAAGLNPFPQAQVAPQAQGVGTPQAQVAVGEGTVAQAAQPYQVAGTQIIPPAGNTFQPPPIAGVHNTVVQAPTAQGHSALGAGGVVSAPVQMPTGKETVISPGNQPVVQGPSGGLAQVVSEAIVR